jgi:hypothetical protein
MKKMLPFMLVLFIGIGIAFTVKANQKKAFVHCCADFGPTCALAPDGTKILGPKVNICP